MKHYVIIIITFLISNISNACILKGTIADSEQSSKLAYINLALYKEDKLVSQTITNENGYFEINIADDNFPIKIKVSAIGYATSIMNVKDCSELNIILTKANIQIPEVSVINYSAKTIVLKALESLEKNLYTKPYNTEVFFRKTQIDNNNEFLYSTEYHSKIYLSFNDQPGIMNINSRYFDNDNYKYYPKALKEGNWEVRSILSYELYSTSSSKKPNISFINTRNIDNYIIELLKEEITIENVTQYVIIINTNEKDDPRRTLKIYINSDDFSISKYIINTYRNNRIAIEKEFRYSKVKGKYFLNTIVQKAINFDNTIDNTVMFTSKFDFDNIQYISSSINSNINTSLKKIKNFNNDSTYWSDKIYLPYNKNLIR